MASSGTTTQTLSIITQSADAYQLLNAQLYSVVAAGSNPFMAAEEELVSSVFAQDDVSIESTEMLIASMVTSDEATYEVDILMESTVIATESLLGSEWTTTISPSTFIATDTITFDVTALLSDTVQVADTFVEFSRDIELESSVIITDTIYPVVTYNQLEVSTVYVQDVISTGQEEFLVENLVVRDTITDTMEDTKMLTDTASAADSQVTWALRTEELEASAIASESFNFEGSTYNNILSSTVRITDSMWAKDFSAIAWTMNTKSGALTNYDNFGFTSMAFHGGKLYATSPEGVFELGADDDDGRDIDALAKGGFLDFGREENKRMSDIFVGYTGGDIECDVETYDGPKEVYTYRMERRDADAPRNNRLKVGRGLSSRYWGLAFRNKNGADFQIQDVAVQIAVSKRRL